jgi:hypothetical protein
VKNDCALRLLGYDFDLILTVVEVMNTMENLRLPGGPSVCVFFLITANLCHYLNVCQKLSSIDVCSMIVRPSGQPTQGQCLRNYGAVLSWRTHLQRRIFNLGVA